jgi:GntR family transcriptional repressor for pyruvate dehydrogenase complex
MWVPVGQSGSIADRIARQVVELINAEALKPGDRLPPERDLATTLGVSRPSLREAVKTLEAQGWLTVRHGQGIFVATPRSAEELRAGLASYEMTLAELFAMREVLEVPAAGWAAEQQDRSRLAAAGSALAELNAAISQGEPDFALLRTLDAQFHMRIVEAAGNRFMRQTLGILQDMLAGGMQTTLLVPGRLERSRVEHERILAAVTSGNAAAARAEMRRHVRSARSAAFRRVEAQLLATETDGAPR